MHAPRKSSVSNPSSRLADFLPYQLSVTSNAVSVRIAQQYRERFGLKTMEWRVMAVLGDNDGVTQRQISELTLMEKVPVNRACKALEDRGLAVRRPNKSDGRSHILELTKDGRHVHDQVMPLAEAIEAELFACLGDKDRAQLRNLLVRVRENAGEFDADALQD